MATLQFRRGSTANLQNIIPAAGEPIWDKQLQKLKVGDGVSEYKDLPYVGDVEVDESSVVFDSNNLVSLFGFEDAEAGTSPVKSNDGKIEWTTLATKDEIDTIQATVDSISDYIDEDLAEELAGIQAELTRQDQRADALYRDIFDEGGIEDRLDAVEDQLANINPEAIEAAINRISGVESRVGTLEGKVEALEEDMEQLENLPTEVAELHDDVLGLDQQINADGGLEDRIEALEQSSGEIDTTKIYTTDDIMIIDGGTADTVIIEAHNAL